MYVGSSRRRRIGGLLLAAAFLATACGARLGSSELAAAKARDGGIAVSSGSGTSATGSGGSSSGGSLAPGGSGSVGGSTGAAGGSTGAAGGSTSAAGGSSSSGGGSGAAAGGSSGSSSSGSAGSGGSGSSSSASGGTVPGGFSPGPGGINPFNGAPSGGNGGSTGPGVTATSITLGNISTQGGPVPGLFTGAYDGALAYVAYVNSLGGIYGRQLKLDTEDDQLEASENKAETDALLPKVLGFLGSFSLETVAGSPDIQAAGAPNVSYAIDTTTQSQSTNFSPQPLGSGFQTGPFIYFGQKFGPSVTSKVAFFIEDNPAAISAADQEEAAFEHVGWKVVYSRKVEATETNFQGDVQTMQSDGDTEIFCLGAVTTGARWAAAMHDAGFTVPFANWGAPAYDPGFVSLSQGGANGSILTQSVALYAGQDASTVPEVSLFDTWLGRVAPGQVPDLYAAYSWAAGNLLTQALIKAGPDVTRAKVLAALGTVTSFDDNGMVAPDDPAAKTPPTCWLAIDIKNNSFVRDPADPATGFICNPGGYYQ
jgi:ABC-type branched-subunit amino acid transport system substrate-binding protein